MEWTVALRAGGILMRGEFEGGGLRIEPDWRVGNLEKMSFLQGLQKATKQGRTVTPNIVQDRVAS